MKKTSEDKPQEKEGQGEASGTVVTSSEPKSTDEKQTNGDSTLDSGVKTEPQNVEVELIGSVSEKTGSHTVFINGRAFNFKNGLAVVESELAETLRSAGIVE